MRHSVLKHVRVRDYLRSLVTHELAVGDAIPSERLLCERFGVSRMTVRQAVDALVVEGLLEREQGRGTFVAPSKMDLEVRLSSFGEEMLRRGMEPSSKVLAAEEIAAASDIADALDLLPGEQVFYLHRVRYADGEPMAIEQSWLPSRLAPGLYDDGPPRACTASCGGAVSSSTGARTPWRPPRSTRRMPICSGYRSGAPCCG
ncbi:GntR family transcriptional regulator [Pengzhenrongella phosphoraccumulans]|uniref:GntR family transcriptional regulator n=1 Tax=Pengzhenrongella phosphoraccumulans TaxID=3114394 RepID=UPI00388F7BC4